MYLETPIGMFFDKQYLWAKAMIKQGNVNAEAEKEYKWPPNKKQDNEYQIQGEKKPLIDKNPDYNCKIFGAYPHYSC